MHQLMHTGQSGVWTGDKHAQSRTSCSHRAALHACVRGADRRPGFLYIEQEHVPVLAGSGRTVGHRCCTGCGARGKGCEEEEGKEVAGSSGASPMRRRRARSFPVEVMALGVRGLGWIDRTLSRGVTRVLPNNGLVLPGSHAPPHPAMLCFGGVSPPN